MKTIIAIWNAANRGKSKTIQRLPYHLKKTYPEFELLHSEPEIDLNNIETNPLEGDFSLVAKINGKIIGIESVGDPNTQLQSRLEKLIDKYNCDVIYCASRTKGGTVYAIENVAKEYSFEVIWTSTYQTTSNHSLINDLKAKHLVDLTQELGLI